MSDTIGNNNDVIDVRPRNCLTPVALVILREESSHGYELMAVRVRVDKPGDVVPDAEEDGE